jgi:myo-inositol-1(or 4)-monophosphatase/deoxyribonuclease-2
VGAPRALRLAHRGDHRRATENTLAAFEAALAVPGCDGVELDVRASADGIAIVLHDETLARTFGRGERARDLSTAVLGEIGVPRLADALSALPRAFVVDVELKEDVVGGAVAAIAAVRGDPPVDVVLSSFDERVLGEFRRQVPGWPCWLNALDLAPTTIERALGLGCAGIAAEWHAIDAGSILRAHEAGLAVAAWTVMRHDAALGLERLGVTALCVEDEALDPPA